MNNIKSLDLRRNKLKNLPKSISKANKTNKLWISNNPYECNCDMLWMKDWLVGAKNVKDKENVMCSAGKGKGKIHYLKNCFIILHQHTNLNEQH